MAKGNKISRVGLTLLALSMLAACHPKSIPDDEIKVRRQSENGFLAYAGFDYGYEAMKSRYGDYCEQYGKPMRALNMRLMEERGWIVEGDCL